MTERSRLSHPFYMNYKLNNMTKKIWILAAIALVGCGGGASNEFEGFDKTETGLYVKYYKKNDAGKQVSKNDRVSVNLQYKTMGDSVLWSSNEIGGNFAIRGGEVFYKGDFAEELTNMHEGDSATLITSLDSFFTKVLQQPVPKGMVGSMLKFDVGVVKTQSEEEVMAEREKEMMDLMKQQDDQIKAYLADKGLSGEPTMTGLYYIVTEEGKGPKAEPGKKVKVHYEGTLMDGTKFDSSYDRGEPIEFPLGTGSVIRGWDEGISYMNVGTEALLLIPSHLAYGPRGMPPVIPGNAILKFKVKLVDVE